MAVSVVIKVDKPCALFVLHMFSHNPHHEISSKPDLESNRQDYARRDFGGTYTIAWYQNRHHWMNSPFQKN